MFRLLLLLLPYFALSISNEYNFPSSLNSLPLQGIGVRKKGPLKVYALSLYAPDDCISGGIKGLYDRLRLSRGGEGSRTLLMKLTFKVSAEKMASALCDSLGSRYSGDVSDVASKIVDGCKGGGGKGTTFQFDCGKDDLSVTVNGESMGTVKGNGIGSGFADIYLDEKAVSPTLKKSVEGRWGEVNGKE